MLLANINAVPTSYEKSKPKLNIVPTKIGATIKLKTTQIKNRIFAIISQKHLLKEFEF
jgi:hypothetical protein